MVASLRRERHDVVVWNRTYSKAQAVADATGAEVAATAAEAARGASFVLTSLADDAAVEKVFVGSEGVVEGLDPGTIVMEMSTIAPRTVLDLRSPVEDRGAALLDAPVSGSVSFAEAGTLTIMVGGEAEAVDRARPVLEALSTKLLHVGDLGAGATMKLAVNAIVHGLDVALSEALVLAEKTGVNRAAAYEVFANSAVAAPFVLYKQEAFVHPEEAPVAFSLDLVDKDLELILDLAGSVGAQMEQGETNRLVVRQALEAGLGDRDLSAIAVLLRERG
ncbi:MAG: 3-hydroxyisobutyrate dehydrogenase [Actinomycetota bacterium]|nr:3-hydroxyisobutyrate dehydrogenase [Actinomycetota bacterium]